MRTGEILKALTHGDGIEIHAAHNWATVTTIYRPYLRGLIGGSIFEAAIKVSQQMITHPDCPPEVKAALKTYDKHSRTLQL